jgi:hypothetical protein
MSLSLSLSESRLIGLGGVLAASGAAVINDLHTTKDKRERVEAGREAGRQGVRE